MFNRKTRHRAVPGRRPFVAAALLCGLAAAQAQPQGAAYPTRQVRLLVGTPPAGLADIVARALAGALTESMGQTFFVDNKPGAGGVIATDAMAKAPADGHVLLAANDSMVVVNQFVYPRLPYDPNQDVRSVAMIGKATLVLVVNPDLGVRSLDDFVKLARSRSGRLVYGSGGIGHPLHLAMELLIQRAGLTLEHVPYKGAAPAVQGVLAGEVQAMIVGAAEAMAHIKAGKLVALAATGPAAAEMFPSLPPLKSLHPDLDLAPWFGLFAPGGTAAPVVAALNTAANRYLRSPEARKRLAEIGVQPVAMSPRELDAYIAAEREKYGPLVKKLGITP